MCRNVKVCRGEVSRARRFSFARRYGGGSTLCCVSLVYINIDGGVQGRTRREDGNARGSFRCSLGRGFRATRRGFRRGYTSRVNSSTNVRIEPVRLLVNGTFYSVPRKSLPRACREDDATLRRIRRSAAWLRELNAEDSRRGIQSMTCTRVDTFSRLHTGRGLRYANGTACKRQSFSRFRTIRHSRRARAPPRSLPPSRSFH